jgi:hypothetical protein
MLMMKKEVPIINEREIPFNLSAAAQARFLPLFMLVKVRFSTITCFQQT